MKRFLYATVVALAALFTACDDTQEGATPGGDSMPNVVLYQFKADSTFNADDHTKIRLSINSAVDSLFLLAESEEDYNAHFSGDNGAYANYIEEYGEKIAIDSLKNIDMHLELSGLNYITAVAVGNGQKAISQTVSFNGMTYTKVTGTDGYVFTDPWGAASEAELYVCDQDENVYRLSGAILSAIGDDETFDIDINIFTDDSGAVVGGDGFRYLSISAQETPFEYGNYGIVSVRDIATMQGDPAYSTSSKYGSIITDDNQLSLILNVYVSAGNLVSVGEFTFGPAQDDSSDSEE